LRTKGAAGPSGLDADGNRGEELCNTIAKMARKICTEKTKITGGTTSLEAYTACRLIPLNKNPGVRPIGIGEVLRRIIGKSITSTLQDDIIESAGSLQLCAGQPAGCEAAVTAMRELFKEEENDALLLVDATNAFNSLNREAMLNNIKSICPSIATYVYNCYCVPSSLFIFGGGEISSEEGTTQGDPLAMPVYAVGITPLMSIIKNEDANNKHVAFADDLAGTGKLKNLLRWWCSIGTFGPKLGYYPNSIKSWLIVKPELLNEATKIFQKTGINITVKGRTYLGSFIGTSEEKELQISKKIEILKEELICLCQIATSEPQAAYCGFITGFKNKFMYLMRTTPDIKHHLKPIDEILTNNFIPAITDGHVLSKSERILLSLPTRYGGLAIPVLQDIAENEFEYSQYITANIARKIVEQDNKTNIEELHHIKTRKFECSVKRDILYKEILENLRSEMSQEQLRANDLAQLKSSSSWLTSIPLKEDNLLLNKREFFDGVSLRYRWQIKYLATSCVCGSRFDIDHAMTCKKGGFISCRHNEIRDILAKLLDEVCRDVEIEPPLLPLTGETLNKTSNNTDEARLDFSARDFWNRGERAFFDVRVINPFALRHRQQKFENILKNNEKEKKTKYNTRITNIEHGSFTPVVMSCYGGIGREGDHFVKSLAKKLSVKKNIVESKVISYVRTQLCFALLRASLLCLRGTRVLNVKKLNIDVNDIELVNVQPIN